MIKKILTLAILILFNILASITLEDAKILALENNNELLAQEETTKNSKYTHIQNTIRTFPTILLNGSQTEYDKPITISGNQAEENKSYGFTINKPIFDIGKKWMDRGISKNNYKISKETLSSQILATIKEVESKYFNVLESKALLEIAQKSFQNSQTNLTIAKEKYDEGALSKADYLNIQSEFSSNDVNLIQSETSYVLNLLDLANYLGLEEIEITDDSINKSDEALITVLQSMDIAQINNIIDEVLAIGIESNSNLKISELSISSAKKKICKTKLELFPTVELQYSKNWVQYDFEDEFTSSGQAKLNISLPIFSILDTGLEVVKKKKELRMAHYSYDSTIDAVSLSIKRSILSLIGSAKTVKSSDISRQYASQTYDLMQERFAQNLISSNELLSSEIMLSSANNQYIMSFYSFLRTRSELLQLIGTDDIEILTNIINNNLRGE